MKHRAVLLTLVAAGLHASMPEEEESEAEEPPPSETIDAPHGFLRSIARAHTSEPEIAATGAVEGIVVDDLENAPVQNAVVTAFGPDWSSSPSLETDEEGRFFFEGPPGSYSFTVESGGQHGFGGVEVVSDQTADLLIQVSPMGKLRVLVQDESGAPLANATAEIVTTGCVRGTVDSATTDASGSARFELSGSSYFVKASGEGFVEKSELVHLERNADKIVRLKLPRGGSLIFDVYDENGARVAEPAVSLFDGYDHLYPVEGEARDQPRFVVRPGKYTAEVQAPSRLSQSLEIEASGDAQRIDVRFPRGFIVSGRVLDDGHPVPRAQVMLMTPPAENEEFGAHIESTSDDAGVFRFTGLPAGEIHLRVPSSLPIATDDLVEAQLDGDLTIDLQASFAAAPIAGRVPECEGTEFGTCVVIAQHEDRRTYDDGTVAQADVLVKEDGSFEITDLPKGTYRLFAVDSGARHEGPGDAVIAKNGDSVILHRERTGSLEGRVDFPGGRPREYTVNAYGTSHAFSGADFAVRQLLSGTSRVAIAAPGFVTVEVQVEIQAARTTELRVELKPAMSIRGTVLDDLSGRPLAETFVWPEGGRGGVVVTDRDGVFEIVDLEPGLWTLWLSHVGHAVEETDPIELGAQPKSDLVVRLSRGEVISGHVVDGDRPIDGVRIWVGKDEEMLSASTDAEGRFRLPRVSVGRHRIRLLRDEREREMEIDVPQGGLSHLELRL